jgi:hypothetical protein
MLGKQRDPTITLLHADHLVFGVSAGESKYRERAIPVLLPLKPRPGALFSGVEPAKKVQVPGPKIESTPFLASIITVLAIRILTSLVQGGP